MIFRTTTLFDKQAKKLKKRYKHVKNDIETLIENFESTHRRATNIQKNLFKIRLKNSDKNRGKSAGYRLYYYIQIEETVYFLTIYDKSDTEMIDEILLSDIIGTLEKNIEKVK